MDLALLWFLLVAFFWLGYLVLEGFDFGVGMLLRPLGRTDTDRRLIINTIGPVWDGNEVWLLVAVGATFAAFPQWYATMLSGFYLPILAIVAALIIRGVAFEFRGKINSPRWRARWDAAITVGSWIPAMLWGLIFASLVRGVDLTFDHQMTSSLLDLLSPYTLLGSATTALLFATHGAIFIALKTDGPMRARAGRVAAFLTGPVAVGTGAFVVWTQLAFSAHDWTWIAVGAAVVGLSAIVIATRGRRERWAFTASTLVIAALVTLWFGALFPNVMPAANPANSLTIVGASSSDYTLGILTWTGAFLTPLVIGYQVWTYWVFRKRLTAEVIPAHTGLPARVKTAQ